MAIYVIFSFDFLELLLYLSIEVYKVYQTSIIISIEIGNEIGNTRIFDIFTVDDI